MNHEVLRIQLLELSGLFLAGLLQEDCYRRPLQTTSASNTTATLSTTTMFSPPQRYFYPPNSYLSILNRMLNKQKVIISSINYRHDEMRKVIPQDFDKWREILPVLRDVWSFWDIQVIKMKKSIDKMLKGRKSKDELIKIR
ncbi:hypothetical protein HanPI659440_Chr12g0449501 [Helianthus annuus]|nr:hypothetical protein HanPI659440_Chr12g0449501 [Helianthus annuus]